MISFVSIVIVEVVVGVGVDTNADLSILAGLHVAEDQTQLLHINSIPIADFLWSVVSSQYKMADNHHTV